MFIIIYDFWSSPDDRQQTTDYRQTESDTYDYEPTVQIAQLGSKLHRWAQKGPPLTGVA